MYLQINTVETRCRFLCILLIFAPLVTMNMGNYVDRNGACSFPHLFVLGITLNVQIQLFGKIEKLIPLKLLK